LDPDAVWGGEWGRLRDGCNRWGWWSSKGKGSFGVFWCAIVTKGMANYIGRTCSYLIYFW